MNIPGYDAWKLRGPHDDDCPDCDGQGKAECPACCGDDDECPECEGSGYVECDTCSGEEPDGDYEYERRRDREYE